MWQSWFRREGLLFRVKKGAFDPRKVITDYHWVKKVAFFTQCIPPELLRHLLS